MNFLVIQKKTEPVEALQWDGDVNAVGTFITQILEKGGIATLECSSSPCSGSLQSHKLMLHTSTGVKPFLSEDWAVRNQDDQWSILSNADRIEQFEEVT